MVSIDCNLPTLLPVEIPPQLTTPESDEEHDESLSTRTTPTNKRTESMVSYVLSTGNIIIDFPESPRDVLLRREIVDLVGVPHVFTGDVGAPDEDDSKMPSTAANSHTTVTDDEYLLRSVSWKCLAASEGKRSESYNGSADREEKVPQESTAHQSCDKVQTSCVAPWLRPPQILKPAYLTAPRIFAPCPLCCSTSVH
eukprot:GEMP01075094.1.p1 GENE.GEMP01075094.1~~GEMP01075094.1.p1  ORF type:complete len:224 (+),score=39.06 GEMP01075094.1:82-672(+)